jgi:hypothetical protein
MGLGPDLHLWRKCCSSEVGRLRGNKGKGIEQVELRLSCKIRSHSAAKPQSFLVFEGFCSASNELH